MEPFDVTDDPAQGTVLTPDPSIAPPPPSPADVGILPDVSKVMGPAPQLPLPAAPPPPPSPLHDPRQQLLALAALGMAIGQGPHGGGAGAFQGFMQGQQHLQADQLSRYKLNLAEHDKQQTVLAEQQRALETDYRQRESTLQKALADFKLRSAQVTTKAQYDQMADATGNLLRQSGYRTISPDWLRANIPYMKPSEAKVASEAFDAWLKNPNNKRLLDENPEQAFQSLVEVDLNGDGVKERVSLPILAEKAGKGFAKTDAGYIAAPKGVTGNGAFDVKYNALLQQFLAENRREPSPKERNALVDKAILATKEKPPSAQSGTAPTEGLDADGLDYAATMMRLTGKMPPMGMGKTPDRARIINRAAGQAKALGQTPAAAIQKQAAYAGDAAALKKMTTMSAAAESFETKALGQADIIDELSQKVTRTKWPIVNSAIMSGKTEVLGDSEATRLVNAITTFSAEYAKIMEGSTGSAAGSSESARKASERLISARMSKGTLRDTLELMRREMALTIQGYNATSAHITERMGGQGAGGGTVETWVRDKNGKLVKQ